MTLWGWRSGVASLVPFALSSWQLILVYNRWRRKRSAFVRALTLALAAVAERAPRPELRTLLPDLRAVQSDLLQQDPETRQASREAVARIEALTVEVSSLPLPVQPTGADTFPIPAANAAERSRPSQSVKSAKSVD